MPILTKDLDGNTICESSVTYSREEGLPGGSRELPEVTRNQILAIVDERLRSIWNMKFADAYKQISEMNEEITKLRTKNRELEKMNKKLNEIQNTKMKSLWLQNDEILSLFHIYFIFILIYLQSRLYDNRNERIKQSLDNATQENKIRIGSKTIDLQESAKTIDEEYAEKQNSEVSFLQRNSSNSSVSSQDIRDLEAASASSLDDNITR